jgi:Domain of unknown function (DUF4956)
MKSTDSSIERLAARIGVGTGSRKIGRTTLTRLSIYYAVVLAIVAGLTVLTDNMQGAPGLGRSGSASPVTEPSSLRSLGIWDPLFRSVPPLTTGAAVIIGAFLLAVPVAFTYVRTRNKLKYDQSLVQTVIMLPVVVTAILIVVQNSIALAFSLAGIVAAVRFRNNLKDSRDAVYVLAAVGIGFASGVGSLPIAALLSIVFCTLELLLWKMDLTADHEHTFGLLCLPASDFARRSGSQGEPAPAGNGSSASGDASAAVPSADTGLLALGGATPVPDEGAAKKPADRLLVYSTDPDKARHLADAILAEMAKSYKLKRTRNGGHDQFVLEYRVRTRRKSPANAIVERLHAEGTGYVIAAEVLAPDAPERH